MRVHFIGIGGIGMSALAHILLNEGCQVSGSDLQESAITRALALKGATVHRGHDPAQLGDAELVVITSAAHQDNPEVAAARARGVRIIKRAELLGRLMRGKRGVGVAGSHGKTTTTALLACALVEGGFDPTVVVGGEVPELGGNARSGSGAFFIAEADEFDASFLHLHPEVAVVTNIEAEHLDYYGDLANVVKAFGMFLQGMPAHGHVVFCLDDPILASLQSDRNGSDGAKLNDTEWTALGALLTGALQVESRISFGFHPRARWRAERVRPNTQGGSDFTVSDGGAPAGEFTLRIPGRHNVSNALGVIAAARSIGVELGVLQRVLSEFGGVKRRFQLLGEARGVTVIDDYAHHPSEVRATLAAARSRFGMRRVRCVFQPHTYSRTKLLEAEYRTAFRDADAVSITEVYAAREENTWGASGAALANSLEHPLVAFTPGLDEAVAHETRSLRPGDVLVVMGAGDVYQVGERVLAELRGR